MQHDWIPSTLGHGEKMCSRCLVTNREAAALGITDHCDVAPKPPPPANDSLEGTQDEIDGDAISFICPVTWQPCCTEQDEFCEDYGCARKAGIDVDRDLIE